MDSQPQPIPKAESRHDGSEYADSAQAREMDRRLAMRADGRYDQWGNLKVPDTAHTFDYKAARDRELSERRASSLRIARAVCQMEALLGIEVKS